MIGENYRIWGYKKLDIAPSLVCNKAYKHFMNQ